jgi:hypothetical protein
MDGFRVWVRSMDNEYRVAVDGLENARWLVAELSRAFIFKSAQPIAANGNSALCTFQVPCNAMLPYSVLHRLLASIPQVTLVMQPAYA